MRLQFRISLAAGAVIAVVASTIGGLSLTSSLNDAINTVDTQLERMTIQINTTQSVTVTHALDVLSANGETPIFGVFDVDGQITVLSDHSNETFLGLDKKALDDAVNEPQTLMGQYPIRIRSIKVQNDEIFVIGLSLAEIYTLHEKQKMQLWVVVLTSALMGWLLIGLLIRPDLTRIRKLISSVSEVADGNLSLQIPEQHGNSEVMQLSRALKQMLSKLQLTLENERRAQENMTIFFGDISHELRTPLTVIKGYAELLYKSQSSVSDIETRGFAQMRNEITRMEVLIDDLMLLNELHMDAQETSAAEQVDLTELVDHHLEKLSLLQPKRKLNKSYKQKIDLVCNRTHVERLFANIFSNIQRHTPDDAPVTAVLDCFDSHYVITVEDGGPGLPFGIYEKGIKHFQRFDRSRSRKTGGSGLGMSIMVALVERLHGTIEISQGSMGGLRTRISLPRS